MARRVEFTGGKELEAALRELVDATGRTTRGKATMRRALAKAGKLLETRAKELAPRDTGQLADSITTGTRLTRRQARIARKVGRSAVEVHVGTADPVGILQEFGTFRAPPQPFMGPAWDETQDEVLARIGEEAWREIEKTAKRAARAAARRK